VRAVRASKYVLLEKLCSFFFTIFGDNEGKMGEGVVRALCEKSELGIGWRLLVAILVRVGLDFS
jgi:hypothetical protein